MSMRTQVGDAYSRYGPMVYRRALRILGNDAAAEDVLQDVFIKAYSSSDFLDRRNVSSWLYRVTTNLSLNRLRDERHRSILRNAQLPQDDRCAKGATLDDAVQLRRLLAELDARQVEAAIYVYVDGMSYSEAAPLLGVSKRTVGNLVRRFKAAAQAHLLLNDSEELAACETGR